MKSLLALFACIALVAATAPLLHAGLKENVPNQYMVVLQLNSTVHIRDAHIAELAATVLTKSHERILNVFSIGNLIGFSVILTKESLAVELEHPLVRYIEADQVVHLSEDWVTQSPVGSWGQDIIDNRDAAMSGSYSYYESSGKGVVAYVIDTGVLPTHTEFSGRVSFGIDTTGEGVNDGNGHGTHVAGTIGGKTYGLAKNVNIVAVKVLNAAGSGTWAGVVSGIDWVTNDHKARVAKDPKARSVANMSLGGGKTTTVDAATSNSVDAGVSHVVAAGNSYANACSYSPAGVPNAITVGATDSGNRFATFSNLGPCVDILAPGVSITSSWIGSSSATNTISGTSMASPHVAGVVALYLGHLLQGDDQTDSHTPVNVHDYFVNDGSTLSKITSVPTGTANRFLFSEYSPVSP